MSTKNSDPSKDGGSSSKPHHASSSSIASMFKDGVDNFEDSVTKKWLSWMLKRHVQSRSGTASDEDANRFVDSALQFARDVLISEGLDPMTISDDQCVYQKKLLFVTLNASVEFSGTKMTGASSLYRQGDAALQLEEDWITIEAKLSTRKIQVESHCRAELLDIGPSFDLKSEVDHVDVRLKLRVNINDLQVVITSLEVTEIGATVASVFHANNNTNNNNAVLCSVADSEIECDTDDALATIVARLFIRRTRDTLVRFFEFESSCQLQAALKRIDLAQLVRSYGRMYVRQAADALKSGLPNLPLP